jgi:hypothetical protein
VANKQYRLTEAEWQFIQRIRQMNMDTFVDIIIALRNEIKTLEKKAEVVQESKQQGWQEDFQFVNERIDQLHQFEHGLRKMRPLD